MTTQDMVVLFTMDCEPAKADVTAYASRMSGSGPQDYQESERSIRAYVSTVRRAGFSTTLFVHPEVAVAHAEMLLELQDQGACLGLHLHPYKFGDGRYRYDLGAYSSSMQRQILAEAADVWREALGQEPLFFRAGYFSANDSTFGVLQELGFEGGSVSIPGRILPEHCSVWAGAHPYPHRAHLGFRQLPGESDFIEIPVLVDFERPTARGAANEIGYEWLYIPAGAYDHQAVASNIVRRIDSDAPQFGVIVANTHNDQDYSRRDHPSRGNLDSILRTIETSCSELGVRPIDATLDTLCDRIRAAD